MKKLICIILATIISICSLSFNAYANNENLNDESVPERYSIISDYSANLSISGITATCTAKLRASSSASLSIKMELQKKKSGVYETIKTWSTSSTGTSLSINKTRAINVLATYRLKVTFKAGGETATVYRYVS